LDQYGGDASHACAGTLKNGNLIPGVTGFFYVYKDTAAKHWMWCDPAGNRFWMTGVQVVDYGGLNYQTIVNNKYTPCCGSTTGWAAIQSLRLQSMGFNTIGEFSNGHLQPLPGENPNRMPFITFANPAAYVLRDTSVKDIFPNLPPRWDVVNGYRAFRTPDFYDPAWPTFVNSGANLPGASANTNPWYISVTMDDNDFLTGTTKNQFTWMIATTVPWEQFENDPGSGYPNRVFSDPVMHAKQQWSTWLCGTRYANVGALNAAWGSSYSTCGSSATTSGTETIGTGTGAQTSFSYSFAHGPVDPASIGISVGGVLQGGDSPWFNSHCGTSSGTGCVQAATGNINGGTVSYNSGGTACGGQAAPCITVTFSSAPGNGVAITATYQYGGWPKATAGGTGVMDEDGTSAWWPAGDPVSFTAFPDPPVTTITTDMDTFLGMFWTQYFKTMHDAIKAILPNHVLASTNSIGGQIARNSVFQVVSSYTDVVILGVVPVSPAQLTAARAFYNTYGEPVYSGLYIASNPDSQFAAFPSPYGPDGSFPTQSAKGASYQSRVNALFGLTGNDGYGFEVGVDYWQYTDNSGEHGAYGLVSLNDNLYNGVESCGKSITDPWGLTTVPEPTTGCYGDFITPVKAANRIWLGP
jgi:hypothetical protein